MSLSANCIDIGTPYCPCKLAEIGQCPACSLCNGESFCKCDISGFCVYQELLLNKKSQDLRKTFLSDVTKVLQIDENIFHIHINLDSEIISDLKNAGSFIFVRKNVNSQFDIPVCVLPSKSCSDELSFVLVLKGIKTIEFKDIKVGEKIYVRAPFQNGILGKKNIDNQKNGKALIVAKGIGLFPSLAVIEQLKAQNNRVQIYLDEAEFKPEFLHLFQESYNECTIVKNLDITDEIKNILNQAVLDDVNLIHLACSDYLISRLGAYLDAQGNAAVKLSCTNNAKMCCGEGICGACSTDSADGKTHKFCKEQISLMSFIKMRGEL